jgi:hypothetical protein
LHFDSYFGAIPECRRGLRSQQYYSLLHFEKMKNSILLLAVGCLSAAMLPGHAFAQNAGNLSDLAGSRPHNVSAQTVAPSNGLSSNGSSNGADAAGAVGRKALKDFHGRFANVTNEKWFFADRGFVAYCTQDGFTNRAYYDKKGHWQYSLKCCDENKIPRDVRNMVRRTYFDFKITMVQVIEIPDNVVYLVHLEDATSLKIVRVTADGDMDVYEDLTKI